MELAIFVLIIVGLVGAGAWAVGAVNARGAEDPEAAKHDAFAEATKRPFEYGCVGAIAVLLGLSVIGILLWLLGRIVG